MSSIFPHTLGAPLDCETPDSVKTVKTRILVVSDTHCHSPTKSKSYASAVAFNYPLPPCDIFIHAGDMTNTGTPRELANVVEWISKVDAEVKIVIAGKVRF